MMKLTHTQMVAAMMADDARYDGTFFVCVRSTGIYCLPSCTAKDPLLKNVVFHRTKESAVAAGFRGCLRCKSEFFPDVTPRWLNMLLRYMGESVGEKITERDLAAAAGVDGSTIRRYFRLTMRTTPIAYHRKLRLEHARALLERGTDYLSAAFESGFESSSGFREAFIKQFGVSPGRIHDNRPHNI